jgi:hypothetical protein
MAANRNRLIVGSALGLAAIAVAIDHTHHSLPEPTASEQGMDLYQIEGESPCSLSSPCAMGQGGSPCSLGSPCSMGGN